MAVLDPENDTVVIRVVYDGPPMAGKTTSVKRLASGFGGSVVVPEEIGGRTLFFDWLDYTGGLFEGRRIRCQIVSVPGQATLASRRRHLIESADVVVFVGDSTRGAQSSVRSYLDGLRSVLAKVGGPPVGIVLQANKRDHVDAVPLDEMRHALSASDFKVAIVESVATEGSGIREAFVFAVRLALDRVRELMRSGQLQTVRPEIGSADDLLSQLKRVEGDALVLAADTGLVHRRLSELLADTPAIEPASAAPRPLAADAFREVLLTESEDATSNATTVSHPAGDRGDRRDGDDGDDAIPPAPPGSDLPSGMIWPPVDGRLFLHEATAARATITRDVSGDWVGGAGDTWTLQSPSSARFGNLDAARAALLGWARQHVASAKVISPERCVVLAQDAGRTHRLWQIIRIEPSLRDRVEATLAGDTPSIAKALLQSADLMLEAAQRWSLAGCRLPLSLRTVGVGAHGPRYIGRMPYPVSMIDAEQRPAGSVFERLAMGLAFAKPDLIARRDALIASLDASAQSALGEQEASRSAFLRRFVQEL